MTLAERPFIRLCTLCILSFAQGLPYGFVVTTLVTHLAARDVPATKLGLIVTLATLPWSFKWVWGPVIDRFGSTRMGRRRPWILLAQLLVVMAWHCVMRLTHLLQVARLPTNHQLLRT